MKTNNQKAHELMNLCWHEPSYVWIEVAGIKEGVKSWSCEKCGKSSGRGPSNIYNPSYDSNIADAFKIIEFMKTKGWSCVLANNGCANTQNGCKFFEAFRGLGSSLFDADKHEGYYVTAKTMPEAIVLAFLETMEKTN